MNANELNDPRLDQLIAIVALQEVDEAKAIAVVSDPELNSTTLSELIDDSMAKRYRLDNGQIIALNKNVLAEALQNKFFQFFDKIF